MMVMVPGIVMGQASAAADLVVTGTVPPIVKIGFGSIGTDGTLTFADLTTTYTAPETETSLLYAANVGFKISVQSLNSGVLVNSTAPGSFDNDVGYQLDVGATTNVDLSGGTDVEVLTGQAAGGGTITVAVTPNTLDFSAFNDGSTLSTINAAGDYTDTLTFTITSE